MDPADFFYEIYLVAALFILLVSWQLRRSRFGAGLLSIREDEDTARMLGVPTERYKRLAFVVSAVLTGVMGVIFAHSLGYITTESVYRDDTNLSLIVYSLLGGMGTLFGPVIGAFLLVFITQVILGRLLDFHLFATGLLLVILVLSAPGGIAGLLKKRKRTAT
jgi:branched-chain amino acid transport system permease protein